jgi:polysaccharide pyruvyl transferase WcaK-like protein
MTPPRLLRLGAFGFFGIGNLGNEGSLAALLEHVRSLDADVDVRCFAGDPDVVRREHGVEAVALMSHRPPPGVGGRSEQVRKAWGRLVDGPRIWRLVGQVDVVVVPGMGVLEPVLGGANLWGFAYWQLLATIAARLRRRPFVLLSVGMGVPSDRRVRFYYRATLRLARYSTFRDHGSRSASDRIGGHARPGTVTADLAFGLAAPAGAAEPLPGRIVLGVMTPDTHGDDGNRLTVYTHQMSRVIVRLLDHGHSVRVVVGDLADRTLADRIAALVMQHRPSVEETTFGVSDANTLHALMTEMVKAEVVVASRYHNLVCALMVPRPAVSLGYAEKNAELLADFGLAGYDQSMTGFDVELLDRQVQELRERRTALEPEMTRTLERLRAALRDQYRHLDEQVFGLRPQD